jgi:hypothetical protein
MLGQATASMTLDPYGHLFSDHLDDVADRLDVIGRATADNSANFLPPMLCRLFADCQRFADVLRTIYRLKVRGPFVIEGQRTPKGPDLQLCTWARPDSNRR